VTATEGITTTIYISNYFEWTTSTANMVKYYYAGAVRVAMRKGTANPLWLLGDHLGSTSIVANNDGSKYTGQGYKAWGEKRYPAGASTLPTTFRYTGQRESASIGLYWYGSRYYDTSLGRFTSPDTVIPEASQGVQAWDRYAYSYGNPVKYYDPSGHIPMDSNPWVDNSGNGLDKIFDEGAKDGPPHPDAPPDFQHPEANGEPSPPHIDGLSDNGWEWNDNWPGIGPGYKNKDDPSGTIWRPDDVGAGEMPHWHGRVPGDRGKGLAFPENYQWGRGGQRNSPGVFDPQTGRYESSPVLPDTSDLGIPKFPLPRYAPTSTIPLIILLILVPLLAF